ncbi:MAG: cysteine--tRNA ligase, partial [Oscillospiraceae bacterium]|nr:cysteine--tRNA ligase [Oscillospiraceae bacterium]
KMSMSKGEVLTVALLEEKGDDPLVYRFFCLQSHYRKSLVFSYENLDNAAAAYKKLTAKIASVLDGSGDPDEEAYSSLKKRFTDALDNDLNTALAVTAVYDVLKADTSNAVKLRLINEFDEVLSLGLVEAAKKATSEGSGEADGDIPDEVKALAEQRKAARKDKNFALADEIRDKITALGYVVTETREGTKITKA